MILLCGRVPALDTEKIFQKAYESLCTKKYSVQIFNLLFYLYKDAAYHNMDHINLCLYYLNNLKFKTYLRTHINWEELEFSIFFHDSIRQSSAPEHTSAILADMVLENGGASAISRDRVKRLIESTNYKLEARTISQEVIKDVDIMVLAEPYEKYRELYSSKVRQEYSYVPDNVYASSRIPILESILENGIYYTDPCKEFLEKQAKENIEQEIDLLRGK